MVTRCYINLIGYLSRYRGRGKRVQAGTTLGKDRWQPTACSARFRARPVLANRRSFCNRKLVAVERSRVQLSPLWSMRAIPISRPGENRLLWPNVSVSSIDRGLRWMGTASRDSSCLNGNYFNCCIDTHSVATRCLLGGLILFTDEIVECSRWISQVPSWIGGIFVIEYFCIDW